LTTSSCLAIFKTEFGIEIIRSLVCTSIY
jgi:hypothetical protein